MDMSSICKRFLSNMSLKRAGRKRPRLERNNIIGGVEEEEDADDGMATPNKMARLEIINLVCLYWYF